MNKKEKMDLLLSKVAEDQKEAFVAELRDAKTKSERADILKKYNANLTEEEVKEFRTETANKLSDEELDMASGGGCCTCKCGCECGCF